MTEVASIPGVSLDLERSTLHLADRSFPVAVAIDPTDGEWWGGVVNLNDPRWAKAWCVFIPMENGALIQVSLENGALELYLHAPVWVPTFTATDEVEVAFCSVRTGEIALARPGTHSRWFDCEPEWAAEHIDRLSRRQVRTPSGRPVELRPIREAMPNE